MIAQIIKDGVLITLTQEGSLFRLAWEEWAEDFADLSIALIRFGVLVACVESERSDHTLMMSHDFSAFVGAAENFVDTVTS